MNPSHLTPAPINIDEARTLLTLGEVWALEDDLYLKLVKLRQEVEVAVRGAAR